MSIFSYFWIKTVSRGAGTLAQLDQGLVKIQFKAYGARSGVRELEQNGYMNVGCQTRLRSTAGRQVFRRRECTPAEYLPVCWLTPVTATPAFSSLRAVPPVLRIENPCFSNILARSAMPVLSDTLSSAKRASDSFVRVISRPGFDRIAT